MHVESEAIREIEYDAPRRRLLVEFQNGGRYAYFAVPAEVHRAFVEAESKGRFFQAQVRDRYRFQRLDGGGPVSRRGGPAWPGPAAAER